MDNDRDLFFIAIFTFITVASWIFFELVKTTKTTTVSTDVQQIVSPFSPTLDTNTLTILESKKEY